MPLRIVLCDELLYDLGSSHFESWVPRRRMFGRGMKLFSVILWVYEDIESNFYGGTKLFCLKKFWIKSSIND